jgi:hypothetical protein
MIAAGDDIARSAFWLSLRERPSSPSLITQELDPGDILEVRDVAEAIARAEALVRPAPRPRSTERHSEPPSEAPSAPPSAREDLFDALGLAAKPTDDAAGPAVAASSRISSVPPPPGQAFERGQHLHETSQLDDVETVRDDELELIEPTDEAPATLASASLATPSTPGPALADAGLVRTPSAPILHLRTPTALDRIPGPEDDAFYHPGGRIRGMADVTIDGRPEPTLMLRLRARRSRLSWTVGAALLLLAILAAGALSSPLSPLSSLPLSSPDEAAASRSALHVAHPRETPTRVAWTSTRAKLVTLGGPSLVVSDAPARRVAGSSAVFDVKSLPRAR